MNAWDYVMMELVKAVHSRWDWSFIDARILWPVAYFVGICILLRVLDHNKRLGNQHEHESYGESITPKGRDQGE